MKWYQGYTLDKILDMPAQLFFLLDKNIDILIEQDSNRLLLVHNYGALKNRRQADRVLFPYSSDIKSYEEDDGRGIQLLKQISKR